MVLQSADSIEDMYQALPTKTHIRVLSFQPLLDGNLPIQCTLHPVNLEGEDFDFHALSYTWGDPIFRLWYEKTPPAAPIPIICNGVQASITANLNTALRAILKRQLDNGSEKKERQYLWVDSLCINQKDIEERNSQVAMMSQIYGKASLVISWLGPMDEDSEVAIPLMHQLIALNPQLNGENMAEIDAIPVVQYTSLTRFLARRYFFRCWVLQEIILARSLRILCGPVELQLDDLHQVALIIRYIRQIRVYDDIGQALILPARTRRSFQYESAIIDINSHRRKRKTAEDPALSSYSSFELLLGSTRLSSCFDPKDKFYSILGIVPPYMVGIEPDYRRSVEEVFSQAIRLYINETRTLNILSWVADRAQRTYPTFPSWIGEFEVGTGRQQEMAYTSCPHDASFGSVAPLVTVEPESFGELHVRGIEMDSIVELAEPSGWHGLGVGYDPIWMSMALKLPLVYPTGQTRGEALIYTLVANEIDSKTVANYKAIQNLKEIVRRDTCFALIRHLHQVCWFSDLADTGPSYDAAALPILQDIKKLAETDESGFILSLDEVRHLESVTCTCNANLAQVDTDQPTTTRSFQAQSCLYSSEIISLSTFDPTDPDAIPPSPPSVPVEHGWTSDFSGAINQKLHQRRVARTQNGYLALVPDSAEVGDAMWLLQGARVPFVLREVEGDREKRWEVIGDSYVHGVMRGELWKEVEGKVGDVVLV